MAKPPASWSSFCFGVVAFLLALLGGGAELGAQSPTWQQRPVTAPSARNNSAAAYDVYRGVTTVFGGYNGTTTAFGDTWEWNGTLWAPRITSVRPSARWGHGMAFDQKRGRVVLFGGTSGSATFQDTWEWDGFAWSQRTTPIAPSARRYAGLVYDAARGVCVLFGGFSPSAGPLNETWEYDGFTWTQCMTSTAPSPRGRMAMAWDETRRETLVFGGGTGTNVTNDLWAWNGTTWSQKSTPIAPLARWDAAFAFDGNCGRALLGGGGDATWATNFGDTWAWDGLQWTQIAGAQPPARHSPILVHDAQRGQFVLWGGRDAAGFRNDTWELGQSCSRTMSVVAAPVVGQTAQFRYDYPGPASNLHFCWTLLTPRQPAAFAVPIPGLPTIGLCRVDLFNQLLDPAVFLDGSGALVTSVALPNSPVLTGFQFDVQSVDLDLFTLALRWAENDLEVTTAPPPVPVVSFTVTPQNGLAPLNVQFTDTSTNGPTSWQWDFDNDGIVDSTQQNPSWTYLASGFHSVRLEATNSFGTGAYTWVYCVYVGPLPSVPGTVAIPAGNTFIMGSASPAGPVGPVHLVTLTYPFWIGQGEVTQAEFVSVMGFNPSSFYNQNNSATRPVENVTEADALMYCALLTAAQRIAGNMPQGYVYRLPTEVEWEMCCRAGTTTEWNTGTGIWTNQANFGLYWSQTTPSGSYPTNPWGLVDMHGNVAERCYAHVYQSGPLIDPLYGSMGLVVRGGSYMDPASCCRSAWRAGVCGNFWLGGSTGFRVVLGPVLTQ
jgi:formylglycine-generating enzyme required for sulfatase activity